MLVASATCKQTHRRRFYQVVLSILLCVSVPLW